MGILYRRGGGSKRNRKKYVCAIFTNYTPALTLPTGLRVGTLL